MSDLRSLWAAAAGESIDFPHAAQVIRIRRARRISVISEPASADAVWSIVELWDFGVDAVITPPGPDEVLAPAEAYRLAEEES